MNRLLCLLALSVAWQAALAAPPRKQPSKGVTPVDAGVPDAAEPANTDPCGRNATCLSCVTSITASCGWCVDTNTCVYRDDGACGASYMASMATNCPPPGAARTPLPKASDTASPAPTISLGPQQMPDEAFVEMLDAFKEAGTDAERLKLLEAAAASHFFRVTQAMEVVDGISAMPAKHQACEMLRKRLVDRQNLPQLYGRFKVEADRKKAQKIMEAKN